MSRYLLDTGIAQDLIYDRGGVRERTALERRRGHRIGICMPVLGELWSGAEGSHAREENVAKLLRALTQLSIWPYDKAAAERFGRLFTHLRRAGRAMQQIDIQIAAIALSLGNTVVVSSDSDLAAVPGLVVENWAA